MANNYDVDEDNNNNKVYNNSTKYQSSTSFLKERTGSYVYTKNFNTYEHAAYREIYKNELYLVDPKNIKWDKVQEHWMEIADKSADPNSSTSIRPKLKEHLKEHFSIINNFYLRREIEKKNESGDYNYLII